MCNRNHVSIMLQYIWKMEQIIQSSCIECYKLSIGFLIEVFMIVTKTYCELEMIQSVKNNNHKNKLHVGIVIGLINRKVFILVVWLSGLRQHNHIILINFHNELIQINNQKIFYWNSKYVIIIGLKWWISKYWSFN